MEGDMNTGPAWLLLVVLLAACSSACSGGASESESVGAATAAARRADGPRLGAEQRARTAAKRRGARPAAQGKVGIVRRFLHNALRTAGLTDEQRARIGRARRDLRPTDAERAARRAVEEALADGVRSGSIDAELVRARSETLAETRGAQRLRQAQALESLHGILTPAQRLQVIERLGGSSAASSEQDEQAVPARPIRRTPKRHEEPRAAPRRPGGSANLDSPTRPGRFERWRSLGEMLSRLELTAEQNDQLQRARDSLLLDDARPADQVKWRKRRRAARARLLESFASPRFDPADFFRGPFEQHRARRLDNEMTLLDALLPILDPSQRSQLASMLLERALP